MTQRIQAYFENEDEAEGAKTALIPFGVTDIEVSALTDPLDKGDHRGRNILLPLVPYNTSAMAGQSFGVAGAAGLLPGAVIVPGINVDDDFGNSSVMDAADRGPDDLHYVMALKVPEEKQNEVVEILRGKRAIVEIFEE
ncbi:hypothetical protein [Paenibacillus sp. BAC0078]